MKEYVISLAASIFIGLAAAGALALGTPLWLLSQMGGPVSFFFLWFLAIAPFLVTAWFITRRSRGILAAIVCGIGFSIPVMFVCFRLPYWYGEPHLQYFRSEITRLAWATPVACAAIMIIPGGARRNSNPGHSSGAK